MRFLERIVSTLPVCLLMLGFPAQAGQGSSSNQPGHHLEITEVFVDFGAEAIVITGEDFDFGPGPLLVLLGDVGNPAAGNITATCVANLVTVPQEIVCDFSGAGLPPDGDYLLAVSTGQGQSTSSEHDLTIGAVGGGLAVVAYVWYRTTGHSFTCLPTEDGLIVAASRDF